MWFSISSFNPNMIKGQCMMSYFNYLLVSDGRFLATLVRWLRFGWLVIQMCLLGPDAVTTLEFGTFGSLCEHCTVNYSVIMKFTDKVEQKGLIPLQRKTDGHTHSSAAGLYAAILFPLSWFCLEEPSSAISLSNKGDCLIGRSIGNVTLHSSRLGTVLI